MIEYAIIEFWQKMQAVPAREGGVNPSLSRNCEGVTQVRNRFLLFICIHDEWMDNNAMTAPVSDGFVVFCQFQAVNAA